MGRHELAFCTPATAALYQHRCGLRQTRAMPFGEPLVSDDLPAYHLPAGHVYGSAMLHVSGPERNAALYGRFQTAAVGDRRNGCTAQSRCADHGEHVRHAAASPAAAEESIGQLIATVTRVLAAGRTPVVHAYVLGKAQEVTKILTDAGLRVVQHALVYEISLLYQTLGWIWGRSSCVAD